MHIPDAQYAARLAAYGAPAAEVERALGASAARAR